MPTRRELLEQISNELAQVVVEMGVAALQEMVDVGAQRARQWIERAGAWVLRRAQIELRARLRPRELPDGDEGQRGAVVRK